jgi:hypothetical protein
MPTFSAVGSTSGRSNDVLEPPSFLRS